MACLQPTLASSKAASSTAMVVANTGGAEPQVANRARIKLSTVLDQAKDQEISMLSEAELVAARARWSAARGEQPLRGADPTDAQLSALQFIVRAGLAPYADFAFFGRRQYEPLNGQAMVDEPRTSHAFERRTWRRRRPEGVQTCQEIGQGDLCRLEPSHGRVRRGDLAPFAP